jgi:hypothetical protein
LEGGSARHFATVASFMPTSAAHSGVTRCRPIDQPVAGIGLEDHVIGVAHDETGVLV